jgi:tetratricopeptide (TPR) repeat protein
MNAGFDLALYGRMEAAIPDHEKAARLDPSPALKSILSTTYVGAGDERLGIQWGGGPLGELRRDSGKLKAEEILSWVSKVRQLEGKGVFERTEAREGLDEALDGSLRMYDKALVMDPASSLAYGGRGRAFHKLADHILMPYGIFPIDCMTYWANKSEGKLVRYGSAQLGMFRRRRQKMPDLQFVVEILWLYECACKDYQDALRLDPTNADSYVELSHVQRHLGKVDEASKNLGKALAILNMAIQADNADEQSYSERAEIFEELGEIDLAIADLQRLLTLSTSEYRLYFIKWAIEELRKRKGVTPKE